jgi:Tol biopolymer transport system component
MWAFAHWSAAAERPIASLLATEPEASQDSSYALWLSGPDGQAAERIYPPQGENSLFPRIEQYLDWSPDGRALAFIFDDALHLMDVRSGEVYRAADDDRRSSHPTWAPYGSGISGTAVNQP